MSDIRKMWLDTIRKWRLNPTEPGSDEYWSPELETASRDKLKEIQSEKLEVLVRYLWEFSPFYRDKLKAARLKPADIKSVEDLVRVPIATKAEMTEDVIANPPWGTYLCVDDTTYAKRGWMVFTTSGTTAAPRPFRYTLHDRDQWAWNDARMLWAMGIRPGDSALLAFGFAPHVFFWGVHYAFNLMGVSVIPGGSLDTKRRAFFIQTFKPTILGATPSYALYLGEAMREMGSDPAESAIRIIVSGGEPGACIPSTKRRIEAMWNAKVVESYGCTEASPAAGGYTCIKQSNRTDSIGTHLMEDCQVWETVDAQTLEPVAEGERGLTVVTNLFSEASPALRFLVGDYTTLTREPCECGRTHARAVGGFYGRADDMVNIRGVTLFPSSIEQVLRGFDEIGDEFQIVLHTVKGLDEITIVAEPKPGIPAEEYAAIERKIADGIRAKIELRPSIELKPYGSLPKTEFKAKRVIELRKPT